MLLLCTHPIYLSLRVSLLLTCLILGSYFSLHPNSFFLLFWHLYPLKLSPHSLLGHLIHSQVHVSPLYFISSMPTSSPTFSLKCHFRVTRHLLDSFTCISWLYFELSMSKTKFIFQANCSFKLLSFWQENSPSLEGLLSYSQFRSIYVFYYLDPVKS